MKPITHIRTSNRFYWGVVILIIMGMIIDKLYSNGSIWNSHAGIPGIFLTGVIIYALYKRFFGKGKIMLTETEFKVRGHDWMSYDELVFVYPFTEPAEGDNGPQYWIHFRIKDGTDLRLRSEYLEMDYDEIAALVHQYKAYYNSLKEQV